ncbi:MAG: hypothetical protein ABFD10_08035 [Prolixibacteraceae bacterium]
MIRRIFILVVFLGSGFSSLCQKAQIAQSAAEIYTAQARDRILNYYSALNLITGNKLETEEKNTIISEINKMFENDQVYVTNDIDPSDKTPVVFKSKEYLENIRLFYSNSEVSFRIDSLEVSDIYIAKDFYFIKIEVFREMAVTLNDQQRRNVKNLDFYVKFVPNLLDCQIYSVKNHEDNLSQFTKAKISTVIPFIAQQGIKEETVAEKEAETQMPPVEDAPKVASQKALNSLIKEQSRKQGFWGVTTLLMAGAGGYFLYESDQKYKEYQNSTDSHAADLRDTAELYDQIGPALLGVAGLCAIKFTVHSIKKGKAKDKLSLYQSRNGITLSWKF